MRHKYRLPGSPLSIRILYNILLIFVIPAHLIIIITLEQCSFLFKKFNFFGILFAKKSRSRSAWTIGNLIGPDSSDIKKKRSQISDYVKNTSWKMIFAKDLAEFDQLWTKLKTDVVGLDWDDVIAVDTERAQKIVKLLADAVTSK